MIQTCSAFSLLGIALFAKGINISDWQHIGAYDLFQERIVFGMKLPRKRYLLPLLGLTGLLVFLLAGFIFLPKIISLDSVKRDIEIRVSNLAGGKITCANAKLEWAPWPQLVFRESRIEIPQKISGTIDSLIVIPKLIPLMIGNFSIGKVTASAPHMRIQLPENGSEAATTALSLRDAAGAFVGIISEINKSAREKLQIHLIQGKIELIKAGQPVLTYQDIDAALHFSPDLINMNLTGTSNQEESIAFSLNFDPARLSGESRIELNRFLPENADQLLFPGSNLHFGESRLDFRLDLVTEKMEKFSGTLSASFPLLTLTRGQETRQLREGTFEGSFSIDKDRTEISLSEFNLGYPMLNLTGSFLTDTTAAQHRWEITALDLNLADTGSCVRFLIGHIPLVQTLCSVLKEGWVSKIELKDEASSLNDLKKVDNLQIHGFLDKGTVYIPPADLTLTEASGWVDVRNGILEGNDLDGQLGNAKGHGTYRMQLTGEKTPFLVDAMVSSELDQLPALLHKLVDNTVFKQEMTKVSEVKGTAEGRLLIDHTQQGTSVKVDISHFNLMGRYARIPYPVTIAEGEFHYDDGGVRIENLRGSIGESFFSGLKASIGTSSPYLLDIAEGQLTAHMDEVLPWLKRHDTVAPYLKPYESLSGHIAIKSPVLKGPSLSPRNWIFSIGGDIDNLKVITPLLPMPVTIRSGSFLADPETLVFDRMAFETPETNLEAQGRYLGYLKKESQLETTLMGTLGADLTTWVRDKADLPSELAWQSPIHLTPITLVTNQKGTLSVSGSLGKPNGPVVEIDLNFTPKRLIIKRLNFRDDDSDATVSILFKNDIIDLGFKGHLDEKTLNAFFTGTPFLSGHIEGDFKSRIFRLKPLQSDIKGHLYIGKLDFSKFEWPLIIHQASIAGIDNGLKTSSTRLTWQDNTFLVDGEVSRFKEGLNLDLTTAIETIGWPQVVALLENKVGNSKDNTSSFFKKIPFYGNIQVHADDFIYNEKMAFRPFEAAVSFADKKVNISISQAKLCGLSLTGNISYSPDHFQLNANPTGVNADLAASLTCVWGNSKIIDGQYQLGGHLNGKGNKETPLIETLAGELSFSATQGRIYRFGLFAKIFTLLNVAGLIKGEAPDLEKEGFPYKTTRATATLENGKLMIKDGEIDSNAMRIFFSGEENLSAKTHDLTIVVAPLSTIDMLVRNIPLVRSVLDKGVVVYPITITGTWENPQLNLLAPTAVGEQIWGVIFRALKLPIDIIKPVFSGGKKETPEPHFIPDKKNN